MHELSLAQSILDIVIDHVPPEQRASVHRIHMKLGAHSGVVRDSLEFCFTAITAGTPFARARLLIDDIPFMVRCASCGATSKSEAGTVACPACGDIDTTVVSGTELQITEVELDDNGAEIR